MKSKNSDKKLSDLSVGQSAVVESLDDEDLGVQRLMALGVVEGCKVLLVRRALGGDPLEISIRDAALSVRKSEAKHIRVQPSQARG